MYTVFESPFDTEACLPSIVCKGTEMNRTWEIHIHFRFEPIPDRHRFNPCSDSTGRGPSSRRTSSVPRRASAKQGLKADVTRRDEGTVSGHVTQQLVTPDTTNGDCRRTADQLGWFWGSMIDIWGIHGVFGYCNILC